MTRDERNIDATLRRMEAAVGDMRAHLRQMPTTATLVVCMVLGFVGGPLIFAIWWLQ